MDHFNAKAYYLIDEALTWAEASDRCAEGNAGYLAEAKDDKEFKFLRGMYDKYRTQGGDANGAWIDGTYDNITKQWMCDSHGFGSDCLWDTPWSHGEPNRLHIERCLLVWFTRNDGVANYMCSERMPAICATYR